MCQWWRGWKIDMYMKPFQHFFSQDWKIEVGLRKKLQR